jgi:hypothetical protein
MKLMIKVAAILVAVVGMLFYFVDDKLSEKPAATPASFEKLAKLPSAVEESSGVVALPEKGHYLTHNDAGNKPYLYKIDEQGKLLETYKLDLKNVDWEDIAQDNEGNIYIGDIGNNNNNRRELAVYKVNLKDPKKVQAIRYTYEDQKQYPPSKKDRNFDSEAMFWYNDNLYLISKDRGLGETAKVYKLPAKAGKYKAELIGSHKINAEITGADISPEGNTVALASNGKLHLFSDFSSPEEFYEGTYKAVPLKATGQTEAVAFENESTLIITSEGGNLYRYSL